MKHKTIDIYNNIFITGKPGIGKSYYMLDQIKRTVGDFSLDGTKVVITLLNSPAWEKAYYTGIRYVVTNDLQKNAFDFDFIDSLIKCGLLIIDDFGISENTRRVCDIVLELLSGRSKPTIIISNLSLQDIGGKLDERVASRLKTFVFIDEKTIGNFDQRKPTKKITDIYIN